MSFKKTPARVKAVKKPKVEPFQYGDLSVICKCGRTQVLKKGIEDGIQLILTNRDDSYIQLRCDSCDADMRLALLRGEKPEEVETTEPETIKVENEGVPEESKQEQTV